MRVGLRVFRPLLRDLDVEQFAKRGWITNDRGKMLFCSGQQPKPLRMDQHDANTIVVFVLRTVILSLLLSSVIGDVLNPAVPLSSLLAAGRC